jgi:hypothetical protein
MRRFLAALAVCVGYCLTIGSVQAQNLYVPLTSRPGDGTVLELVAVNPDTEVTRVFSGVVLAENANGATTPGTPTEQIGVAPTTTRVVTGPSGLGLWRLKGYAGLQLSARLRVPGGVSQQQGDAVPILSSDNLVPANTTVETSSLIAAAGFVSDVGVFNGGEQPANCSARVILSQGNQVGPSFLLILPPLSFNVFDNVPSSLVGGAQVSNVRVSMHCDQKFFVLARTINAQTGYVSIHTASTAIGRGLPDPGTAPTPTPPPPPPGNSPPPATALESFTRPGSFYTPSAAEPQLLFQLPVTPNVAFSKLALSFEVEHGGWNPVLPDGVMNIAYLTRGDFTGDVFASITVRGPNRNVLRNGITVDLPQNQEISRSKNVVLQPGTVYRFDYLYDWPGGAFTLTISDDLGPLRIITGPATGPVWTKNKTWTLLLSEAPREGHVPNLGWEYSDLVIEWRP